MAGYTIMSLEEIPDVLGDYPGEMRMSAASDLGTEQVGFTWRRMPPLTGGKGSYGHRHFTLEEVYFVASGTHRGPLFGVEPTGGTLSRSGINLFRIRDGRIVEATAFFDSLEFNELWTRVTPVSTK